MRNGRDRRSGKPENVPREERTRANVWDPISGLHQGQRPQRPHSQAEYMAAPDPSAEVSNFLLHRGRRPYMALRCIRGTAKIRVAIGGIADKRRRRGLTGNAAFDPQRTSARFRVAIARVVSAPINLLVRADTMPCLMQGADMKRREFITLSAARQRGRWRRGRNRPCQSLDISAAGRPVPKPRCANHS